MVFRRSFSHLAGVISALLMLVTLLLSSVAPLSHAFHVSQGGGAPSAARSFRSSIQQQPQGRGRASSSFSLPAVKAADKTTSSATAESIMTTTKSKSPMFEYLKFDGNPKFDVLAKTKQYIQSVSLEGGAIDESIYDDDYVLRGPVIGPINRQDLRASQKGLGLAEAFPNIRIDTFGYTIDPENPYRCFYFQRWRSKFENDLDAYGDIFAAPRGGVEAEMPVSVFSVVWTPSEKIIYEQVGAVVDRFEGNTQGKAAVFGLLHTAGLKLDASPGNIVFATIQRIGHWVGGRGRSWSKDEDVPKWWTSQSRGADSTD